jgi:hypothetical protein
MPIFTPESGQLPVDTSHAIFSPGIQFAEFVRGGLAPLPMRSGAPDLANLVNARRPLPIENVRQSPRVSNEINLQFTLLVNFELGSGIQNACALVLVLIIYVEFASR